MKEVQITLYEIKREKTVSLKLDSYESASDTTKGISEYKGLSVEPLDEKLRNSLRISPNIQGVVVTQVKPKSPAKEAGILRGDIIIQIENAEIRSIKDFNEATKSKNKKRVWIYRQGGVFASVL